MPRTAPSAPGRSAEGAPILGMWDVWWAVCGSGGVVWCGVSESSVIVFSEHVSTPRLSPLAKTGQDGHHDRSPCRCGEALGCLAKCARVCRGRAVEGCGESGPRPDRVYLPSYLGGNGRG
jgi:hypothetical protein